MTTNGDTGRAAAGHGPSGRVGAAVTGWALWDTPVALRAYVLGVPTVAVLIGVMLAAETSWRVEDLLVAAVLLTGGALAVENTRRLGEPAGAVRDLLSAWWLPAAVLLPPVYALIAPAPLMALTQWRVGRTLTHRRVFSAASIGLSYAAASTAFHLLASNWAGPAPAPSSARWALAVTGCGALAAAGSCALVAVAVKATDPQARWRELLADRDNLALDALEICVGAVVALVVAASPLFAVFVVPPVLLVQRALLHGQLRAAARTDAKTGLLNAVAWERDAQVRLVALRHAARPAAVLLIDIDHFKRVNDSHGHLAGDQVLGAVADALHLGLRDGDLLGRFGGEEFAVLLPHTDQAEAARVAERLRRAVAQLVIPLNNQPFTAATGITVSLGVAVTETCLPSVQELLAAADAGLYRAKRAGRDRVHLLLLEDRRQAPANTYP